MTLNMIVIFLGVWFKGPDPLRLLLWGGRAQYIYIYIGGMNVGWPCKLEKREREREREKQDVLILCSLEYMQSGHSAPLEMHIVLHANLQSNIVVLS